MQYDSSFVFLPANSYFLFVLFSRAYKIRGIEVHAIETPAHCEDLTRATDT